ncbi:hypothetical protein [Bacillus sp. FJAT-28004]|uniref:hypothetical protein n=1 Tax=Bacillus sp. FJAT-28004 TaxID=1679165 RepID=UPI0006B579CB|nr:hypothetical protein [Bacillus sp. FJAT-28004]
MGCELGRIIIERNEGTIIFGNVGRININVKSVSGQGSSSDSSSSDSGSGSSSSSDNSDSSQDSSDLRSISVNLTRKFQKKKRK